MKGKINYIVDTEKENKGRELVYPAIYTFKTHSGDESYVATVGVSKPMTSRDLLSLGNKAHVVMTALSMIHGNVDIYEVNDESTYMHIAEVCDEDLVIHRSLILGELRADIIEDFLGDETFTGVQHWVLEDYSTDSKNS